ncbi:hypothetical protein EL18_00651 [Nitratireductor basaltis]|uniref:Uncharacterized protein n=1 Tax=Nitratireductor basaltis TaxID=472175 RepID=A0A084U9J9_9HYPH|nr:hypothetical protein EL18_00651 [Nitratireductor basaltis]
MAGGGVARDSVDDSEIEKIFSQPLFTGCLSEKRI